MIKGIARLQLLYEEGGGEEVEHQELDFQNGNQQIR